MSNSADKIDQPEPGTASGSSQGTNAGFYDIYSSVRNVEAPRPSFLEDSEICLKQGDTRTPNTSSVSLLPSAFGSLKRKRLPDVVAKPSFKVSSFLVAPPHLPKFGMSLNTAKFNFATNSRSAFYSGRTKFGGSSSCREDSAKRIKIMPVSKCARTNTTRLSAKPYCDIPHKRTLSSKTAENILKTLNEMCSPIEEPEKKQPFVSDISSSYLSLSKRLREKRKTKLSVFQTPIQRVNQIQSRNVSNTKVNTYIGTKEIEPVKRSEILNSECGTSTENKPTKFPILKTIEEGIKQNTDISQSVVNKPSLKMKRQRITTHYSVSDKNEEPVNTMPEVTTVQPLIMTSLPKFDMSVKTAMPLFTHVENEITNGYKFRTPKAVTDKKLDSDSIDTKYLFVSPIPVKNTNPATPKKNSDVRSINAAPPSTMPNHFKDLVATNKESSNVGEVETERPVSTSTNTSSPGIGNNVDPKLNKSVGIHPVSSGFKFALPEEGSWECPTCMIMNKPNFQKCAACTEPKPGNNKAMQSVKSSFSFGQPADSITKSLFTFGKTSAIPSASSFASSTNPTTSIRFTFPKSVSAVSSTELSFGKPSVASSFSFGQPNDVATKSDVKIVKLSESSEPIDSITSGFVFAKPATENYTTSGFAFTKPATEVSSSAFSFVKSSPTVSTPNPFEKLKHSAKGSRDCRTCKTQNVSDCEKCIACNEPVPGTIKEANNRSAFSQSGDVSKSSTSNAFTFGASSKPRESGFNFKGKPLGINPFTNLKPAEEGSWDCPVCMIVNKSDCMKCLACSESKPGSKDVQSVQSSISFGRPTEVKSEFSFGKPCNDSSVFSFVPSTMSKPSSGLSFVSSSSSSVSSGFSFVSSTTINGSSGFAFGKPANSATSTADFANSASSGFSFGKSDNVSGNNPVTFSFCSDSKNQRIKELQDKSSNIFGKQNTGIDHKTVNGSITEAKTGFNFTAVSNHVNENPITTSFSTFTATNVFTTSSLKFNTAKFNGIPTAFVNNTSSPSSQSFSFAHSSVSNFMINSNDTKASAPPNKFNFNSNSLSTPNFNFGAVGNANTSEPFNFINNNVTTNSDCNQNEESKANNFAHPSADTNLFSMGSGTTNIAQANTFAGPERRKVKKAHRRLQARKK